MIIDTHTHLYLEEFNTDRSEMIQRARDKSVIKVLLPNIDSSSIDSLLQMSMDYPEFAFPMMGLHPCSVKENYKAELNKIEKILNENKCFGVGEIGLDMYWDKESIEIQKMLLSHSFNGVNQPNYPYPYIVENAQVWQLIS